MNKKFAILICTIITITTAVTLNAQELKVKDSIIGKPISLTQTESVDKKPVATKKDSATTKVYLDVNPLDVVANPQKYLNKDVKIRGIFDKFSVVGLDYKPAFRSSDDYILFLIKKNEIKGHSIPLAEMKIFIKRKEAEKFIDLDAGDEIQFTGKVFSTALSDPWIDVDTLTVLNKVKKAATKDTPQTEKSEKK